MRLDLEAHFRPRVVRHLAFALVETAELGVDAEVLRAEAAMMFSLRWGARREGCAILEASGP